MNRRDVLLATAAVTLGAASRSRAQSAKPDQIAVMTWGGQFGDAVRQGADTAFTRDTGIKVVQDRGSTPVERITKVKINERGQIYDVMMLHDGLAPLAVQQGAYEPLDANSPRLPNLKAIPPAFRNAHWAAFIFSELGVCWNHQEVKTPPTGFADLWRPEFKGRVVLPAITHSIGPYIVPIGAMAAGRDPKDETAGFEQLKRVADLQPIWARDTDGIMGAMRSGEAVLGLLYRSQTFTLQVGGTPVKWVTPSEGAIAVSWGAGVGKGCRNRDAAEQYLNILLGPEAQATFSHAFNYPGTNPATTPTLPADLQERVRTDEAALARLVHLDHAFMGERRAAWTERWNRIVSG